MGAEPCTNPEQRRSLRAAIISRPSQGTTPLVTMTCHTVEALCDDADALAGALAEVARLTASLASIGARVNRWYFDEPETDALAAIDDVERIVRAVLAPETKGAKGDE